jgi:hypothetical protein
MREVASECTARRRSSSGGMALERRICNTWRPRSSALAAALPQLAEPERRYRDLP